MAYDLQGMPTPSLRVSPVCPYLVSHVKPMGPPHPFNFNSNINIPILQSTFDLWNCTETFLNNHGVPLFIFFHLHKHQRIKAWKSASRSNRPMSRVAPMDLWTLERPRPKTCIKHREALLSWSLGGLISKLVKNSKV